MRSCHISVSLGVMGHSELECDKPVVRNAIGRLPYDIKLRAPDSRKKKLQSFADAAAESFRSSSLGSKHSRSSADKKMIMKIVVHWVRRCVNGLGRPHRPLKLQSRWTRRGMLGREQALAISQSNRRLMH